MCYDKNKARSVVRVPVGGQATRDGTGGPLWRADAKKALGEQRGSAEIWGKIRWREEHICKS